MTVKEKRKIIFKHCERTSCIRCPLNSITPKVQCLKLYISTGRNLDEALSLIEKEKEMTIPKDDNLKEIQEIISGKKQTNFERIKAMSIEEMAEVIDKIDCSGGLLDKICTFANPEQNCDSENCNCINCIKQWLESEVLI